MSEEKVQNSYKADFKEISDEELDKVAGGGMSLPIKCPNCKAKIYNDKDGNYKCTCGWHT